ncbi:peptidoglycan-recognition protein SC2-like [Macrosteles quadrilineatus]|uniref:peptidoglycan-recognition protein SC2-like n=1 Tax=Macrosteles quadrilineatus TaxID=74068 RepID=UPI0023E31B74|nr:peptidoglycan-recognition protein SC2-like [Macrosteles quadrilineatus]
MHYRTKKFRKHHPMGWSTLAAAKITIVKREWWKALPPIKQDGFDNTRSIRYIIYSHTSGPRCKKKAECVKLVQDMQKQHMDWGMPDIRYSFLIGGDDNIYEGRGFNAKPVINRKYPELYGKSIEVAYIGNYSEKGWVYKEPTRNMWDKGWQIIRHGSDTGKIPECELRYYFDTDRDDLDPWEMPPGGTMRFSREYP